MSPLFLIGLHISLRDAQWSMAQLIDDRDIDPFA